VRVAVTGATGLVGSQLCSDLERLDHDVLRVSRNSRAGFVRWDFGGGVFDPSVLEGLDAVVHLAGEPIVGRWTAKKKARIRDSRVLPTTQLAGAIAGLDGPSPTLLCASAIGYYGDLGGESVDETNGKPGEDFLAKVCIDWEDATRAAAEQARVVNLRFGMVLGAGGGALGPMRLLTRLFLGGPLGAGDQIWSWISLDDAIGAILHLLHSDVSGAVNLTSPTAVSQRHFARALGKQLNRPAVLRTPRLAVRSVLGEVADPLMFSSLDVRPTRLLDSGFKFGHVEIEQAFAALLPGPQKPPTG